MHWSSWVGCEFLTPPLTCSHHETPLGCICKQLMAGRPHGLALGRLVSGVRLGRYR